MRPGLPVGRDENLEYNMRRLDEARRAQRAQRAREAQQQTQQPTQQPTFRFSDAFEVPSRRPVDISGGQGSATSISVETFKPSDPQTSGPSDAQKARIQTLGQEIERLRAQEQPDAAGINERTREMFNVIKDSNPLLGDFATKIDNTTGANRDGKITVEELNLFEKNNSAALEQMKRQNPQVGPALQLMRSVLESSSS
jgi:hypothetical protein